ncbi:MAG: integrin alpha [Planctomycetota bacterium]
MHSVTPLAGVALAAALWSPLLPGQRSVHDFAATAAGESFGQSVGVLADANDDGRVDYVIGAPDAAFGGPGAGRVYVRSGADGTVLRVVDGAAGTALGSAVAGVGDVDGDGLADFAAGAPLASPAGPASGTVFVYSGADGRVLHQLAGSAAGDRLGTAVAAAGDANRDGFADVVGGAPGAAGGAGRVLVFSGRDGTVLQQRTGPLGGDALGEAVAGGRDLNGDGADEFLAGMPGSDFGGPDAGRVAVFSGATGLALIVPIGTLPGGRWGSSLCTVRDVNQDGTHDLVAGAPFAAGPAGAGSGRVQVHSGADGSLLYTVDGAAAGDAFGAAVCATPDVNADGVADLLVGAPGADDGGLDAGVVSVRSGRDGRELYRLVGAAALVELGAAVAGGADADGDGFGEWIAGSPRTVGGGAANVWTAVPYARSDKVSSTTGASGDGYGYSVGAAGDINRDGVPDYMVGARSPTKIGYVRIFSGADHSLLRTHTGVSVKEDFGYAVDGAGDVNADGYDDVLIGAPHNDNPRGLSAGRVMVYSGLDGTKLYEWFGRANADHCGYAVSAAGDVDNDGYADVMMGVPYNGGSFTGVAWVMSGRTGFLMWAFPGRADSHFGGSVSDLGDLDGDGHDDVIIGAPETLTGNGFVQVRSGRDGSLMYELVGENFDDRFGKTSRGIGDVTGDGVPDFMVGAPEVDDNGPRSGNVKVFSGVDGAVIFDINGARANDLFGTGIGRAGDVNRDGYPDFYVGAPGVDIGGSSGAGAIYLYSGRDASVLQTVYGEGATDELGRSVTGIDDINADDYPDFIGGSPYDDDGGPDTGSAHVYTSVVHRDPAQFASYGAPCPGADGRLPRSTSRGRAVVGRAVVLGVRTAPFVAPAVLLLGAAEVRFPVPGSSGCELGLVPLATIPFATGAQGTISVPTPIPDDPGLVGVPLHLQWAIVDVAASPLGVVLSDAARLTPGTL